MPMCARRSGDRLRDAKGLSQIQWVNSYVVDDKLYCVYNAPTAEMVLEHAKCGGFPANRVSRVHSAIDPTTAQV
jgi:Nickel responsive protein SCO4226-like